MISALRGFVGRPITWHVVLLLVALGIGARVVEPNGWFSVDEGAVVLQARELSSGGGWVVDHPLDTVDLDGSAFPIRYAERGDDGFVGYAKHPLYPAVASVADRVAGVGGQVALSISGAVAAAVAASRLTRRVAPEAAVGVLYAAALVSPLLFDGYLVIAHTLAAAAVGWAAVAGTSHLVGSGSERAGLAASAVLVAAAVMLRAEAVLLTASATGILVLFAATRRSPRHAVLAAALTGGVAAGLGLELLWRRSIFGGAAETIDPASPRSFWSDRVDGLRTTVFDGSYGIPRATTALLLAACLFLVAVAILRWSATALSHAIAVCLAVLATGLVLWRALTLPLSSVPGILPAFPLLWAGLLAARRRDLARWSGSLGAVGLFAVGVLATQYRQGGGLEWGWRYLAIAMPLIVPVAVLGLVSLVRGPGRWSPQVTVTALLLTASVALSGLGMAVQRTANHRADAMAAAIEDTAAPSMVGETDDDGRPVVVTREFALPQAMWPLLDDVRWLRLALSGRSTTGPDADVVALVAAGVDRFTIVSRDIDLDVHLIGGEEAIEVLDRTRVSGLDILLVRPIPGAWEPVEIGS